MILLNRLKISAMSCIGVSMACGIILKTVEITERKIMN